MQRRLPAGSAGLAAGLATPDIALTGAHVAVASSAKLRPFSIDILDACYKPTNELFTEIGSKNAMCKRLNASVASVTAFRNQQYAWHQACETTFDNYQIRQLSRT